MDFTTANEDFSGSYAHSTMNPTITSYGFYNETTNGTDIPLLITTTELSLFQTYPRNVLNFGAVMCIFNSIFGIWGNFITIAALATSPNLRNATTTFVINLCLADGLFCVIGPPLTVTTFLNGTWVFHEKLCAFKVFAQFANASVSVFTMAAIAINRYILIAHPRMYPKIYTKKTMAIKIAFLWLVPLALWLPALFGRWGQFGFGRKQGICTHLANETGTPMASFSVIALILIIVATIILFCYFRIGWIVRQSARNLRKHDNTKRASTASHHQVAIPMSTTTSTVSSKPPPRQADRSPDLRILRISLVIFIVFVLSYVPIVLVRLASLEKKSPTFYIFAYLAFSYSTCVNPIIYVVMSREYRNAYKTLLCPKDFHFTFLSSSSGSR